MNSYLLLNSLSNDLKFAGVKFMVQKLSVGRGGGGASSHPRLLFCKIVYKI